MIIKRNKKRRERGERCELKRWVERGKAKGKKREERIGEVTEGRKGKSKLDI